MRVETIGAIIMLATVLNAQDGALQWAIAGQAADLITTEIALANGGTELNPLMTGRAVRIIAKATLLVMAYAIIKYYPENKWGVTVFAIVSWLPVGNNLFQLGFKPPIK